MDVAEDIGHPFAIEADGAGRAGFVKTEVEPLAVEEREDIVKEGVLIRKFNTGTCRNDEQMRRELLVLLNQTVRRRMSSRGSSRTCLQWREPQDDVCPTCGHFVFGLAGLVRCVQDDLRGDIDSLG